MKRFFGSFLLMIMAACGVFAQGPITLTQATGTAFTSSPRIDRGGSMCQVLTGLAVSDHTFIFHANGNPSAVLVTITGTTGAGQSTITTSTNTAGASIHFTGVYNQVCLIATTITGANAFLDASYSGILAGAGGTAVTVVDGGDIALGATTDDKCTTTDTTACTLIALTKELNLRIKALTDGTATSSFTDTCQGLTMSSKYYISVGSTEDESQVKATAGTLCTIRARNAHASTNAFLKCTNLTAANTTPGSSAIFFEMMIPFGSGYVDNKIDAPFSVALTCYIVTGKAASDATEVAADDVSYFLTYQ